MAFTTSAVTLIGNVSREPEMRFTPSGQSVTTFGLVFNKRKKNQQTNEWEDGDAQFFDVKCWGPLGENVAESIKKGTRVIVHGELEFRAWETDNGDKRSKVEINAEAVGPDLRFATAQVQKIQREGGSSNSGGGQQASAPAANPFAK